MKSRWFPALAAILGLVLFSGLSVPVAAADPTVKLVLGGTGSIHLVIGNIAPGSGGTNTVTLSNTGFKDGVVTIWISDIVNAEGTNPKSETGDKAEPGELGDYLVFNVSGTNLYADFSMPAKINSLPLSPADTKHLSINPLKAFSTLNLRWEWFLPSDTGNHVQGDLVSFTINYVLEEFPPLLLPPPPPPPPPQGGGGGSGGATETITRVGITKTGPATMFVGFTESYIMTVTNTGAAALNDVTVTDYFPELLSYQSSIPALTVIGSRITWNLGTLNTGEAKEIIVIQGGVKAGFAVSTVAVTTRERVSASTSLNIMVLSAPDATMSITDTNDSVAVGDELIYNIQVTNQSGTTDLHNLTIAGLIPSQMVFISATGASDFVVVGQEVRFSPVATLKPGENVRYQIRVKAIVAGAAAFDATLRCDEFREPVVGQEGTTVFNRPEQRPEPSPLRPLATVQPKVAPASFEVRKLKVSPVQVKPGESISINCELINTGGQSGEFTLIINIPGLLQTSQLIKLEAGQTQQVSLMLPPGSPGTYQVDIGGAKDTFTIEALPPVLPEQSGIQKTTSVWLIPVILAVIGAAALVYYIVIMMMRRRLRWEWIPYLSQASAVNVLAQTAEQRILYATKHKKRVAELASAIAREVHRSKGLVGDDILLTDRILAVADKVETMADTVETMSSLSPYRPAIGLGKALEEIKRNSSTQHDSDVVNAFVRLVNRGKFRFRTRYD